MLGAGVSLVVVKQFLGHSHISTTEIYAKLLPEDLNSKLANWSKEYWGYYTNKSDDVEDEKPDIVPDFLK